MANSKVWVVSVTEAYDTWYWSSITGWHVNVGKADRFQTEDDAMTVLETMEWSPLPEDPGTRYDIVEISV